MDLDLDIPRIIGAVDRRLEARERDGQMAKVVVLSRDYDTTVEDLWDALTSAERIPRWFLPISGELRLGGHYQLEGNAGGQITTCDPPRQFGITWVMGGADSWVDVTLTEAPGGGASLRLEHTAHVPPEWWEQFGPGAVGVGWDLALLGLHLHIASGESFDPAEAEAWSLSDQGKAVSRASSDAWGEAAIAAGEEREAALQAAERTRAFYTGETPTGEESAPGDEVATEGDVATESDEPDAPDG